MQKKIRQLAAIMFTDMVGYTAMMQSDEELAKANRDRHREVLERIIAAHYGLILQYYGDGTLSVFGSAVEAAEAAVEIQQELQQEPIIPLRIGIHVGDVAYDDDGIYGDGVNIASRIETLSVPGSVLVSGKLYDEIKNHSSLPAKALGSFKFKNVQRPLNLYALGSDKLQVPTKVELKGINNESLQSIAVLPFVNMSTDPENEFFSDGISEEIINALTRIDGLQVTSRTSSFAFKGKNEDVREIGKTLNVDNVLEGSVRKAGNRVRVTAQLIKSIDGYHIWSEVYDRDLEDIFAVQDEISRKITNTLRQKLSSSDADKPLIETKTENIDAYNLYLKGLYYFDKWSPENIRKAIACFEDSIKKDNSFSSAYAGLAWAFSYMGATGQMKPKTAFPKAEKFAYLALEKDYQNADSHSALALVKFFYTFDFDGAEKSFTQALRLNPGAAKIRNLYSWFLASTGKNEKALEQIQIAAKQDPLSLSIITTLAIAYGHTKNFKKAFEQLDRAIAINPEFRNAVEAKGWVNLFKGEYDKALSYFTKYQKLTGHPLKGLTGIGYVYALTGKKEKALEIIEKIKQREIEEPEVVLDMDLALIFLGLQDFDKMFEYLKKAFDQRIGIIFTLSNEIWKTIHSEKRYQELIKPFGLSTLLK
ncbi:MAG: guanylate cyclase [Calditrichaeota bacterium]|nr:MAG: guanylate cyclase [Calditrichota bacterium]MBL1205392.1 guanylate cyclase [Calditrichota bacterium]NOG45221.1 tetratricopeptide repeat protein [Calditrichota bacterium]